MCMCKFVYHVHCSFCLGTGFLSCLLLHDISATSFIFYSLHVSFSFPSPSLSSTADSLFFTSPLPASSPDLDLSDCQVPDIPSASVGVIGSQVTEVDYCMVGTDRGSFSSRQIDVSTPTPGKLHVIVVHACVYWSVTNTCCIRMDLLQSHCLKLMLVTSAGMYILRMKCY